jgi:predicted ArsR family transcriptional regulator
VRSRLVAHLRESGPATATELAATLGTNSGATSYHLRRLESVGLVRDTGEGKGRRRVWSAPARSLWWQQDDLDDDSESALAWLGRDLVRHFAEQYDHWLEQSGGWPESWQDACGVDDASVLVTPESLQQMRSELREVVQRYRRVGQGNPRARRVAVYDFAYPVDLDQSPRGDRS